MDENAASFFAGFAVFFCALIVLIELSAMCVAELISRKGKNMFKEQIETGTKLLDEKVPGWVDVIDLERLNLECGCSCNCTIGQAFPDMPYFKALEVLFGKDIGNAVLTQKIRDHGFVTCNYGEYPHLTAEWKAYIQKRRNQDQKCTIVQVP